MRMSKISRWKQKEDAEMKNHVTDYGPRNWRVVAGSLGRSENSCFLRWRDHLSPDIDDTAITNEEAITIIRLRREYGGNKWAKIAKELSEMRSDNRKRTANKVKNFWNGPVNRKILDILISGVEDQPPPDIDFGQHLANPPFHALSPVMPKDNIGICSYSTINCDVDNIGNASYSTIPEINNRASIIPEINGYAAVGNFAYGSNSTVPEINCGYAAVDSIGIGSYSDVPEINLAYAAVDNFGNASYSTVPVINRGYPMVNLGYGSNSTVPEINAVDNFGCGSYYTVPEINCGYTAVDNFGCGSYSAVPEINRGYTPMPVTRSSTVPEINIGNGVF